MLYYAHNDQNKMDLEGTILASKKKDKLATTCLLVQKQGKRRSGVLSISINHNPLMIAAYSIILEELVTGGSSLQ